MTVAEERLGEGHWPQSEETEPPMREGGCQLRSSCSQGPQGPQVLSSVSCPWVQQLSLSRSSVVRAKLKVMHRHPNVHTVATEALTAPGCKENGRLRHQLVQEATVSALERERQGLWCGDPGVQNNSKSGQTHKGTSSAGGLWLCQRGC